MNILLSFFSTTVPNETTPEMLEEMLQKPTTLNWYIVPIFVILIYLIVSEIKNRNYNVRRFCFLACRCL